MSIQMHIFLLVVFAVLIFSYGYSRGKSDGYFEGYKQAKKDIKIKVPKKKCFLQGFLAKILP